MRTLFKIIVSVFATIVTILLLFFFIGYQFFPSYHSCKKFEKINIIFYEEVYKATFSESICKCTVPHEYKRLLSGFPPGEGGFEDEFKEINIFLHSKNKNVEISDLFNYKIECSRDTIFSDKNSFFNYFNKNFLWH